MAEIVEIDTKIGTLSDNDIKKLCKKNILIESNYSEDRVKQACYELRCGNIFYDLSKNIKNPKPQKISNSNYILLKPKQTLVVITHESLRLPNDILGRILTKGVLFSIGVLPVNTYADPGFSGHLGIILSNISNSYIKIYPGEPIAKIEFSRLEHPVSQPYQGQHGYQTRIWPIRNDLILDPTEIKNDPRIGNTFEELELSYGKDLAKVIKRVFDYERKLLLFTSIYLMIMILLIAIMAGTQWIDKTIAVILGVIANVITTTILHFATNLKDK